MTELRHARLDLPARQLSVGDVLAAELRILRMKEDLYRMRRAFAKHDTSRVQRDYLGTLWMNLLSVGNEVNQLQETLRKKGDFE